MNWKPGDIAIIRGCSNCTEANGKTVTVTSSPYMHPFDAEREVVDYLPVIKGHLQVNIRLLHKPYDGHKPCSWEIMDWQPKELVI